MDSVLIWEMVIKSLVLILALLLGFALLTYYERRVLARFQSRLGPNRAGPEGLLQPVADAVKLIFKEEAIPAQAYKIIFILAPIITMVPALAIVAVIPWGDTVMMFGNEISLTISDVNVGVLYIMSVASIAVYGVVLAGWASNNKYAMMGGLRATAQMISYELALGLAFVAVVLLADSMQISKMIEAQKSMWFFFIQPVGTIVFMIATLAELNRSPFDMPEAEQELSSGFNIEYSGMKFALFYMAEYTKMISISSIVATLFFGGYLGPGVERFPWLGPLYLFIKILVLLFGMIWIRASWPRIRYDRLMAFGWKILLPLSLAIVFITALGILLEMLWLIPILSLGAGAVAVQAINLSLRRKAYAR